MTTSLAGSTAKPLIRTLDEIEGADLPLVGGKAFRLARLKRHGLQIPAGFVLTTCFFEAQLHHTQLMPLWTGSPDVAVTNEALAWLADSLKTRPLARELAEILRQALDETFGPAAVHFAVRSSAIDEDQRDHTFAGVHLTELGVPRSILPVAITRCWASALSKPALEYRQVHGMSIQGIRMAVLIQPMLSPASSGVGFTLNPLTGSREEFVVEATWGLGQAVVSGEVQPYFYKLANHPPDYPLLEQRPGNVPPPPGQAETGPLSQAELTELAIQLEQIQALMGEPQDVEWARQGSTWYLLQTRPAVVPARTPAADVDQEWTRGSHPEFLPELPSPLFSSLLERTQSRAFTFFKRMGLELGGLGPYVKLILGRPYLNLTVLKRAISQVGINPGSLLYTIGHTEPGTASGNLSLDWQTAWQARRVYDQVFRCFLNTRRSLSRYQALADEVSRTLAASRLDDPPAALLAHLRQHDRVYGELFDTNLELAFAISAVTGLASRLIAPLSRTPATIITTLALQKVRTSDGELNQALRRLADLARRDESLRTYLANAPADFNDYEMAIRNPEFKAGFAQLLARYDDRGTYETDTGWPRYPEEPAALLRIIRQYAQSDPAADTGRLKSPPTWDNLIDSNRSGPWRRWLAGPMIRLLSRLLTMRDELHTARAKAMAACRRWDLALGQKWVRQGWLEQAGDIFWLTLDEVEQALMVGQEVGLMLSSTVLARKETYQTYAATSLPHTLPESRIPFIQLGVGLSLEPLSDVLVGLPISPGQVRGTVVVLSSPDGFEKIADDIILVTPSTDPAWLPLLHLAAGVIVEMGGLLSHGSVIAREYGLPAVANIPNATQRFRTGDCVLVDGSTGIVQLLEPAAGGSDKNG